MKSEQDPGILEILGILRYRGRAASSKDIKLYPLIVHNVIFPPSSPNPLRLWRPRYDLYCWSMQEGEDVGL